MRESTPKELALGAWMAAHGRYDPKVCAACAHVQQLLARGDFASVKALTEIWAEKTHD